MPLTGNKRVISSAWSRTLLSLLLIAFTLIAGAATKGKKKKKMEVQQTMTVARVIPGNPLDSFTEVTFSESQRYYRISDKAGHHYLNILKEAEKSGKPVIITRANEKSDIILKVEKKKASNP